MKRKFLTVLLALVAVLCLCLGFAACGDDGSEDEGGGTEQGSGDGGTGSTENDGHEHVYTAENKCSVCGKEWEYTEGLEYSYDQTADTYTVTDIGTAAGNIIIPYGHEGKFVTKIGAGAFEACTLLTGVTIPDSVTEIEKVAFSASNLATLTLGNGLTKIGYGAFFNCRNLAGEIKIPDGVTSLMEGAFMNCDKLTKMTIGNGVTTIHLCTFSNCLRLTQVVIGNNVSHIETDYTEVGKSCDEEGIGRFVVPQTMQGTGCSAFENCRNLWEVWNFSKLDIQTGSDEHGRVATSAKYVYTTNETSKQTITDDGYIFYEDGEEVYLHQYCGNQTTLTLPAKSPGGKNYAIYQSAFSSRSSLTNIALSVGVTEIGDLAFAFCTGLTGITVPEGVTKIGEEAFSFCTELTGITIPESVTIIGEGAFANSGLTSIEIPGGVLKLGEDVFYGCNALTDITVSDANPNYSDEGGILYNKVKTEIVAVPQGIRGTIVLPGSVTSIGDYAFSNCTLLANITIPEGVSSIGDYAFSNCTSLTNITIPEGVPSIGNHAFSNCTSLINISIPDSVTTIGDSAFRGCDELTDIQFKGTVKEWQAIKKEYNWDSSTADYTVTCTNGTVKKDGTVTYFE